MGFLRIPNSTPIEKTHEVYVRMVLGCPGQEVRINGERINGLYPTGYIEVKFLNGLGYFKWVIYIYLYIYIYLLLNWQQPLQKSKQPPKSSGHCKLIFPEATESRRSRRMV